MDEARQYDSPAGSPSTGGAMAAKGPGDEGSSKSETTETNSRIPPADLGEARQETDAIINSVHYPLLVVDAALCVQSANEAFADLVQVRRKDLIGQDLAKIEDRLGDAGTLLSLLRGIAGGSGQVNGVEIVFESRPLGHRTVTVHARVLPGRTARVLVAIEDVTESRRIQTLLHENEAQRLEQEHLRQRQIQLTNALRVSTVGELATGLAHELNQPLASISNVVEACTRHVRAGKIDPARLLALLGDVASQSMRAAGIVSHLRSLIEKGEPQLEAVDLSQIVGNVPHLLLRELERARVALRSDLPASNLPILADRIQIEQVIVNIIQNAMDSIQEADNPQRLIEIGTRAIKRMGEVCIRDTGTGVSENAAKRMFEAFFTTKKHGLGMGLALSRSILETHRGRIWMEAPSDGGPGTVVKFAIPLKATRARKEPK